MVSFVRATGKLCKSYLQKINLENRFFDLGLNNFDDQIRDANVILPYGILPVILPLFTIRSCHR